VSLKLSTILYAGLSLSALSAGLGATPRLALVPPSSFSLVPVAVGSNGPTVSVDTQNVGNSPLHLELSSSVAWLVPTLGKTHGCFLRECTPVMIALQTSSLTAGTYTGIVTVTDPDALDAPQTISVTVAVGGNLPDQLQFYLAPGSSSIVTLIAGGRLHSVVATQSGGSWLKVAAGSGGDSFAVPYMVTATASSSMASGDYQGTITVTGSALAADNKTIHVTLHVTADPIAEANPQALVFNIVQSAAKQKGFVSVSNGGKGTLTVSGVMAATTSGSWLSAATAKGGVSVTADPSGLMPGAYQGTVTIASNAANSSLVVPVTLNVEPQGPPFAAAGGVVNNASFGADESLAQGDIVAVFGDQFTFGDPKSAPALPLTNSLAGTQVLVNGQPVPVYFVSAGQINFQIPYDAMVGDGTLSVVRNGTAGNKVFINILARAPRIILLGGGPYGIVVTAKAKITGTPAAPVHIGDVVVIYLLGMGPTTPAVHSGVASPTKPLAELPKGTQVCFGDGSPFLPPAVCTGTQFAGLTPGLVGLYQVNVKIPKGVPKGSGINMMIQSAGAESNHVQIAIQ
jgi:uncharacterized protein (TIGR03437 family)